MMTRDDDRRLGDAIGLGIAGVFTIGGLAAIVHAKRREESIRDYEEMCSWYYAGVVPGYDSQAGIAYLVFVKTPEGAEAICEVPAIWFDSKSEERKFVYDIARAAGLPPGGALLAVAHHMKAGCHTVGCRTPLRGLNLWGVRGEGVWWKHGNPVYVKSTVEFSARQDARVVVEEAKWRFFDTPEDAAHGFIDKMHQYPKAKSILYEKKPNPYAYAWYLHGAHSSHGYSYGTGLEDIKIGGVWNFARALATQMRKAAEQLEENYGYNGLDWAHDIPIISQAEAQELIHHPVYGDTDGTYPLPGYP
jgi:hypothetical protein